MQTLVAVFNDINDANRAVTELVASGVARDHVSVVANNATGEYSSYVNADGTTAAPVDDDAVKAGQGAGFGAVSGGIIGALIGLGALAIPGVGPIIAAGPIVAALTGGVIGAAAGAPTGGIVAALVKTHSIDAEDADMYAESVRRGGVLVTAEVDDGMTDKARDILDNYGPVDIHNQAEGWRAEGWNKFDDTTTPNDDDMKRFQAVRMDKSAVAAATNAASTLNRPQVNQTIDAGGKTVLPVVEESIDVQKRQVEKGRVRAYTTVTERPVEVDVKLREENVTVDRRPVDRAINPGENSFQQKEISMTQSAEQAVVNKTARVVEEVAIGKQTTERTETVSDTVRRTDVKVEETPATGVQSAVKYNYADYANAFQTDFNTRYQGRNLQYTSYEPAYRYGFDLASSDSYRNSDWTAVETSARTDWEKKYPGQRWDEVKDSIRYAWDNIRNRR